MKSHRPLAAALGMAVLSLTLWGGVPAAHAGGVDPEGSPCATREAQVAKAEGALARVTKVFANQGAKVKDAKEAVHEADSKSDKAAAKKALDRAKATKDKVKKAKKAQQQRLAKAQQRLADCQAERQATASV